MHTTNAARVPCIIALLTSIVISGCAANRFPIYREQGQMHLANGNHAAARGLFLAAEEMVPEHADNLCDLAACYIMSANEYIAIGNSRAALRELDLAINSYDRAIKSYPGFQRAIEGKNQALELRGADREALAVALWASKVVGPSAAHQIYLASEYAERGDADQALLAFRQAVAMEPTNPIAQIAIGLFYIELGRRSDAVPHLQEAYRLDPKRSWLIDELKALGAEIPIVQQPEENVAQESPVDH